MPRGWWGWIAGERGWLLGDGGETLGKWNRAGWSVA